MRIGYVLTATTGGIGRHVASVAPRVAAAGHLVRIFCPPDTAAAHDYAGLGLAVSPLASLATATGADVLHAHGLKAGAAALPWSRLHRAPLVVTWHNAVLDPVPLRARLLLRLVARGARLTLGASSDLVALARRLGAREADLAPVAAPALAPPTRGREAVRDELGLAAGEVAVLTVGRLAPQKNLDLLLDVAERLRDRPGLSFWLAGEGPERDRLSRRIAARRLPVHLLGHRADVADLLAAADLALLTSTWEARALVAQEALLAGLPFVGPRVGGIPELVGDAARLVPPGDAAATAQAVAELAADPDARTELAAAGRAQAAAWPDEDAVAADLVRRYVALARPRR